uniref:Uncharacterized protein n=1 Tax=Aeromonas salmonicida subsp. salmonicida TaxID=29491 RepID=A0A1I9S216_AERSS|nr:hypothetical protein [Aeromonas salmonicida]AOZ60608.1 putative hypothetical protein [Aeromonas salmonicida subsp. salmonicida]AOZ60617.1 putative hypothetical protein [Aeromonas salmonicida subsp. salmonicida]
MWGDWLAPQITRLHLDNEPIGAPLNLTATVAVVFAEPLPMHTEAICIGTGKVEAVDACPTGHCKRNWAQLARFLYGFADYIEGAFPARGSAYLFKYLDGVVHFISSGHAPRPTGSAIIADQNIIADLEQVARYLQYCNMTKGGIAPPSFSLSLGR